MPSVSAKQHRFMEMVAHDPGAAKRVGVPQSVGRDFVMADMGRPEKSKPKTAMPAAGQSKRFDQDTMILFGRHSSSHTEYDFIAWFSGGHG